METRGHTLKNNIAREFFGWHCEMDGEASGHGCEITSLCYGSIEVKVYRCYGRSPTTNLDPILHESVRCILSQLSYSGMSSASTGQALVLIMYFM
jgi:hypothetical protein